MENTHNVILALGLISLALLITLMFIIFSCRKRVSEDNFKDLESMISQMGKEELIKFEGSEDLTIHDILEAPGEVIGKSSYGTLYSANLQRANGVVLLRFIRPVCGTSMKEMAAAIEFLGSIRHPNLVPLLAFYSGPRGEKLMVHPYYPHGNLAQFLGEGIENSHKWAIIHRISLGIARGLGHLHSGFQKPVIHGNLKPKNILLDQDYQPYVSDFGLYLLLNPISGQEMLENSLDQQYKAPELIKMKNLSEETDIYSFGTILLELIEQKGPISENLESDLDYLDDGITGFYDNSILVGKRNEESGNEERGMLKLFDIAVACCCASPSLRPNIKHIVSMIEEIEG